MGWLWVIQTKLTKIYKFISIPLWDDCEEDQSTFTTAFFYFNSTMGWLWGKSAINSNWNFWISIPLWDDCENFNETDLTRQFIFQFHYGMIVRWRVQPRWCYRRDFNSTMGWLWVLSTCGWRFSVRNFNSTMGWLWDSLALSIIWRKEISIPLWDDCERSKPIVQRFDDLFQFHYGMIVSNAFTSRNIANFEFQFHYGMIVS